MMVDAELLDLYRSEAEDHSATLMAALVRLRDGASNGADGAEMMRAAHSLKGAAKICGLDELVGLAHAMESVFVDAQRGLRTVQRRDVDALLDATGILLDSAAVGAEGWLAWNDLKREGIQVLVARLGLSEGSANCNAAPDSGVGLVPQLAPVTAVPGAIAAETTIPGERSQQRVLRISAESVDRVFGLAGELMLNGRQMERQLREAKATLRSLAKLESLLGSLDVRRDPAIAACRRSLAQITSQHAQTTEKLEDVQTEGSRLAGGLHQELRTGRMRPFSDMTARLQHQVRAVAQALGKQADLLVIGESAAIDRDVMDRLEGPLGHVLRNALDHGIESPEARVARGKSPIGRVTIEVAHRNGSLYVTVRDDGRGIDMAGVRAAIVRRGLMTEEVTASLSEGELLEILFLPGFSEREVVTDVSGRGVGLDAVAVEVRRLGGTVELRNEATKGLAVELRLPLSLSVLRGIVVRIAGAPYVVPMARVQCIADYRADEVDRVEGLPYVRLEGVRVGLTWGHQLLGFEPQPSAGGARVLVLSGRPAVGVVVEEILGSADFVLNPLDSRLGRVQCVAAASRLASGQGVLVLDVDDLLAVAASSNREVVHEAASPASPARQKRILIVEDSLTVREVERRLLSAEGYVVDVAVDGMEGWHAARQHRYDLIVTDVDMPRLDGVGLIRMLRRDPKLEAIPVIIVSYKDRPEDRERGLEAGANRYLVKASFSDDRLVSAVRELAGDP